MASGGKKTSQKFTAPDDAPSYLVQALKDIGLQEWVVDKKGRRVGNPVVERYIEEVSGERHDAITTAWCAYWVGAKLQHAGLKSTKSGMARSYLKYGKKVSEEDWRVGDIVVTWRGANDDGVTGHVGLLLKWSTTSVTLLGGNQGDAVSIQTFPRRRKEKGSGKTKDLILGVRRPEGTFSKKDGHAAAVPVLNELVVKPTVESSWPEPTVTWDKADQVVDKLEQVKEPLLSIGSARPWVMAILTAITVIAAAYTAYKIFMKD